MSSRRKLTWREKLADDKGLPVVQPITANMRATWGQGTMVIPAPREVDALIRTVRKGRVVTINQLRTALAARHRADVACPITTGIFAWIAAHAAEEAAAAGQRRITPWWRVLKEGGRLNPKFPGGVQEQAKRLRAEGHRLIAGRSADSLRVAELEARQARLPVEPAPTSPRKTDEPPRPQ